MKMEYVLLFLSANNLFCLHMNIHSIVQFSRTILKTILNVTIVCVWVYFSFLYKKESFNVLSTQLEKSLLRLY